CTTTCAGRCGPPPRGRRSHRTSRSRSRSRSWEADMQGDFSRWTFDARDDYRSVLLQQGRVLLDADWNEQTELTRYDDETRTLDMVGRAGGPIGGAGFGIVDTDGNAPTGVAWT